MKYELNEFHRNIPDELLLADIVRVAEEIKPKSLSKQKYKELGKYGTETISRRFGGWIKALELCGITASVYQAAASSVARYNKDITNEELLTDIRRVAALLKKETISSAEYRTYGEYSKDTCFKRFSTWNGTLTAAGLQPNEFTPGKKIDETILMEEIERVWISLGRQPTSTDIKNGASRFTLNAYTRRYGGWRKALEVFVEWVSQEKEREPQTTDQLAPPQIDSGSIVVKDTHTAIRDTSRDVGLRLRFKVMQRDHFACRMCGASPAKDPSVVLHVDHIVPWSLGGKTTIDNLQTLCSKCNLGKGNLTE